MCLVGRYASTLLLLNSSSSSVSLMKLFEFRLLSSVSHSLVIQIHCVSKNTPSCCDKFNRLSRSERMWRLLRYDEISITIGRRVFLRHSVVFISLMKISKLLLLLASYCMYFAAAGDVTVQNDGRQHRWRLRQDETCKTKSLKVSVTTQAHCSYIVYDVVQFCCNIFGFSACDNSVSSPQFCSREFYFMVEIFML